MKTHLMQNDMLGHHQRLNVPKSFIRLLLPLILNLLQLLRQPGLLHELGREVRPALAGPLVAPELEHVNVGRPAAVLKVIRRRGLIGVDLVLETAGDGLGVRLEGIVLDLVRFAAVAVPSELDAGVVPLGPVDEDVDVFPELFAFVV